MHTFKKRFILGAIIFFCLAFTHAPKASAATTVSADITANTTWTSDGSPYVLTTQVKVPAGVTLTIQPGVVVESSANFLNFSPYAGMGLVLTGGSLVADGTANKPIYIDQFPIGIQGHSTAGISNATIQTIIGSFSTLSLSSVVLGALDANGHMTVTETNTTITGDSSSPNIIAAVSTLTMQGGSITNANSSVAQAIEFSGSRATLTNVTIQSVTTGIYVYGASTVDGEGIVVKDCPVAGIKLVKDTANQFDNNFLYLHGSEIAYNGNGIEIHDKPTFQATGNSIHDNTYGVWYSGPNTFPFINNWWGDEFGPYDATSNPLALGNPVSAGITVAPWLASAPFAPTVTGPAAPPPPLTEPEPGSGNTSDPIVIDTDPTETATSTPDSDQTATSTTADDTASGTPDESGTSGTSTSTTVSSSDDQDTSVTADPDTDQTQATSTTTPTDDSDGTTAQEAADGSLSASVIGASDDGSDSIPAPLPAPAHTPVLIVPGVLGTELSGSSGKLWLDLEHNFTDIGDSFMDPLAFTSGLAPTDASVVTGDVLRKESADLLVTQDTLFDYSYSLITELENQGYAEGTDLFVFPYDWRYGASQNIVDQLKQKIDAIRAETGSSDVDVVAHSTGGLIVKKYAEENPTDSGISKAVFVGVPNTGAPSALKTLIEGDDLGIPFLAASEMKKLAQNFPVVYDLLPSPAYYADAGSYFQIIWRGLTGSTTENLSFADANGRLSSAYAANQQALSNASALHSPQFDGYDLRTSGVDLYAIDGCKTGTFGGIAEVRTSNDLGNLLLGYGDIEEVPGDGTVPLASAAHLPIDEDHTFYALQASHSAMLGEDGIRQEIVNILSGSALPVSGSLVTQDVSQCKLSGKVISVYSPLSISVTDANGNRAGIASDGTSIEDTIPNADYEVFGEHKFVYLPTDGGQTYTISVGGTGTGTFTLADASIQNGAVQSTQVFSDVPVTPSLKGTLGTETVPTLALDSNGDGVTDQVLQPSGTLDADASKYFYPLSTAQDSAPPASILPPIVLPAAPSLGLNPPSAPDSVSSTPPIPGASTDTNIGLSANVTEGDINPEHIFWEIGILFTLLLLGMLVERAVKK